MADWNEMLSMVVNAGQVHDNFRATLIRDLESLTSRNVIVYYSGWLQKPNLNGIADFSIADQDMTGFMTCCSGIDKKKGLDIVLHTPGGDVGATEAIIKYLRGMFGADIRAIVPQMAMSGGTQIALAADTIIMGKHSSLGPVDPQIGGRPAQGYLEEFQQIWDELKENPNKIAIWRPILEKIPPTHLTMCKHAIDWSNEMLKENLATGMFARRKNKDKMIEKVREIFGNQKNSHNHARHIGINEAIDSGLRVIPLETNKDLQDKVLSLHHLLSLTFLQTSSTKIIASSNGKAFILHHNQR